MQCYIMFLKVIILLFTPLVVADKSLTIVLDVSASMRDEFAIIQENIYSILKTLTNKNINNFALVPYGDPYVNPIIVSSTHNGLVESLGRLELKWQGDCPEITVTAIKNALEASKPESYIYVFTDAQAKDYSLADDVKRLCRERLSQVFIFLSGTCVEREFTDDVYYDIAKSCNGSVFQLDSRSFHQAFFIMKELSNVDWTEVTTSSFDRSKNFTVSIDVYTENLVAAVSCLSPQFEILNDAKERPKLETIMRSHRGLVMKVEPQVGNYYIEMNCAGKAEATLYTRKTIIFEYGFSPKRPGALIETSSKPLPNFAANILIILPRHYNAEIISVIIQRSDQDTRIIEHELVDEENKKYMAQYKFEPDFTYHILIFCKDKDTGIIVTGQSDTFSAQKSVSPNKLVFPSAESTVTGSILIDYGSKFSLSCKVIGYPEPQIWWEDEQGEKLQSEQALLETPFVFISYLTIDNASKNSTLYCKSKNLGGEYDLLVEYYVNRTYSFDVIKSPSDTTITYNNEGKLYCEVDAYPEAETKWYHNDTIILENSENVEVIPEEHMLRINRMSLDDAGEYKCEVANGVESRSFTAAVYITGLELPQIEIGNTEVILTPGDKTEVTCSVVKGTPVPEVAWKYKQNYNGQSSDLPEGVSMESNTIKIESATVKHGGIYVCEATNMLGVDTAEVAVKVQYAPVIKNGDEVKIVRNNQAVQLACDVDAVPAADVHWDMYQDDVIFAFDDRHHTDKDNTHHFVASPTDSGMYHCIAENSMGKAVRTVTLNVYVKPFIEPLPPRMRVRSGYSTTIPCNVKGNPMPTTKIEFTNRNSIKTVLLSDNSTGKVEYVINKVTKENEGLYECFSQSAAGIDSVTVYLKVD